MSAERPYAAQSLHFFDKLIRALFLTCPNCWHGRMFRHPLAMHERCPDCDYKFDQGNGYFIGAMYSAYLLCLLPAAFTGGLLYLLGMPAPIWIAIMVVQTAVLGPFVVLPYSRVFWVWAEREGHLHDGQEDLAQLKALALARAGKTAPRSPPEMPQAQDLPTESPQP